MKILRLENTSPFQGLAELVADKEGLFEKEGLKIEWVDRMKGIDPKVHTDINDPKGLNPHSRHGKMFEQGKAVVDLTVTPFEFDASAPPDAYVP